MIEWIKNIFQKKKLNHSMHAPVHSEITNSDLNPPFIWCLVGNVVEKQTFGESNEIRFGTKYFSPNTKVHCFPILWGDGYTNIKVIGRHRKSNKHVCVIMPSKHIQHWRIQKVYHPFVIDMMLSNNGWSNSEDDKNTIMEILESITDKRKKI